MLKERSLTLKQEANAYRHDLLVRDIQARTGREPVLEISTELLQLPVCYNVQGTRNVLAIHHVCAAQEEPAIDDALKRLDLPETALGRDVDIRVTGRHFQPYQVRGRLGALLVNSEVIHKSVRGAPWFAVLPSCDHPREALLSATQVKEPRINAALDISQLGKPTQQFMR